MKTAFIMCAAAAIVLLGAPVAGQQGAEQKASSASASAAGESIDLATLLPSPGEIPGWKLDGEPLVYVGDNLWEYIDGSADNFLAFGFRRMIAQNYVSVAGKGLKVEIYEHESPLMAYGIYAQMRSPGLAMHEIGNEAFSDEYSLNFWKGRFYVRVAVFEKGAALDEALKVFAGGVAAKIAEKGELPPEAAAFSGEGLVPNSTCYLTTGVLAREKFPPAFVALYKLGDEEAKLYLSTLPDSAAARDTFAWYTEGLKSYRATMEGPDNDIMLGLGTDPYQGEIIAFSFGKYLGVLSGLKQPAESGIDLVRKTVDRLRALDADRGRAPAPSPPPAPPVK